MTEQLPRTVSDIVALALEEDLGRGDVTTDCAVGNDARGTGRALAKQSLVVSGIDVFALVMHRVDPSVDVLHRAADGERVEPGAPLLEAEGPLGALLRGERVALNFLQRLCGVATLTRRFVDALPVGAATRVLDTRKTTPGLRYLEKRAVVHGGGENHRIDLAGAVLVKENHVAAAGSIDEAVRRCREGAPEGLVLQVEVRDTVELEQALAAGADAVLLDNMRPELVRTCVDLVAGRALVEASGGIGLDNVASFAAAGVDAVSVGALTHSAPAADISFLVEPSAPLDR